MNKRSCQNKVQCIIQMRIKLYYYNRKNKGYIFTFTILLFLCNLGFFQDCRLKRIKRTDKNSDYFYGRYEGNGLLFWVIMFHFQLELIKNWVK